jgi:hypothetical protein
MTDAPFPNQQCPHNHRRSRSSRSPLSKDGRPFNFVLFRPRKSAINLEVKLPRSDDVDHKIEEAGIESLDYDMRWGNYRLSLHKDDITKNRPLLKELMTAAYQGRSA